MKGSIIALLIFALCSFQQSDVGKIMWSKDKKISWSDFKGAVDENDEYKARSCIKIVQNENYKFKGSILTATIDVRATFNPNCSWARLEIKEDVSLLSHEQGHFDIAEIYDRKLRKALKELPSSSGIIAENNISNLIDKYCAGMDSEGTLYDTETNHSQDVKKQQEWNAKIIKHLKELEAFVDASPIIIIR